jgi:phage-related holin
LAAAVVLSLIGSKPEFTGVEEIIVVFVIVVVTSLCDPMEGLQLAKHQIVFIKSGKATKC